MFSSVECTDYTFSCLEDSGIAARVHEEIFPQYRSDRVLKVKCLRPNNWGRDHEVEWTAPRLRKLGRSVKRRLGLSSHDAYGFDSVTGFHIGLGAFVVGEYEHRPERPSMVKWRGSGRKTGVWNAMGDEMVIQQNITDSDLSLWPHDRLFTQVHSDRQLSASVSSWSDMLGLALLYYQQVHPDVSRSTITTFAREHFRDYENPFERALFAECQTDAEVVNHYVPPPGLPVSSEAEVDQVRSPEPVCEPLERKSRLHGLTAYRLRDLFAKGIPDAHTGPIMPLSFPGDDRFGYAYTKDGNLHMGIASDKVLPDDAKFDHSIKTPPGSYLNTYFEIRDWLRFTPDDASPLLRACLAQYSRDRWQVPEILDLYEWGLDLDR